MNLASTQSFDLMLRSHVIGFDVLCVDDLIKPQNLHIYRDSR